VAERLNAAVSKKPFFLREKSLGKNASQGLFASAKKALGKAKSLMRFDAFS